MKWFILIVVSVSGNVEMQEFFGENACKRAIHVIETAIVQPDILICTPKRIK